MKKLTYQIEPTLNQRATLGLIVLSEDETIELEMRQLIPETDVAIHVRRVRSGENLTSETILEMKGELAATASLLPKSARFDCVAYACTSGTSVIGADIVHRLVVENCDATHVTDPLSALIAYCQHAKAKRLGFLSPYRADVSTTLRQRLSEANIETPSFAYFGEDHEATVVRINASSIISGAREIARSGPIDAVFLSCTNLRTSTLIASLSNELSVPVLSSNSVLAWHMRHLSKLNSDIF